MSHSDLCSAENTQEDQMDLYCIPRKFVFDVPETNSKEDSTGKRAIKKSVEAEKHMPFIFSFPEPANYKESYSQLVKQVIGVYNHIRLLIVEEYYEDLKHVIQEIKVQQPGDCLNMLKELFSGCCEKMERRLSDGNETRGTDSAKDYEELLQKAEAKIRTLIRNEQIFRLNFDILSQKCEDADKAIQTSSDELENSKKAQDALKKENQELVAKLFQKDDEVKKANKEREAVEKRLKEAAANLSVIDHLDQAVGGDPKNAPHGLNKQLLGMLSKENKHVPSENSSRPPSNLDGKSWNGIRQSSSRLTPSDRGGNGNYSSTSSSNLNRVQVDRLKNSLVAEFKKHMGSNLHSGANRNVLNASLDVVLNKSTEHSQERSSVNATILSAKKRSSQHIKGSNAQDSARIKPQSKERKLGEYSEKDLSPYLPDKNTMQKILNASTIKYSTVSTRPVSTGKSRESPLMSKRRVVQTEQSPEDRSHESKVLNTYASNQSNEVVNVSYATNSKKRSVESRENKSQSKGITKSSVLVKAMIADQMKKKIGTKAI